jgi:hypothetical protein
MANCSVRSVSDGREQVQFNDEIARQCRDYVYGHPITPEFDALLRTDDKVRKRLTTVYELARLLFEKEIRRPPVTVELT